MTSSSDAPREPPRGFPFPLGSIGVGYGNGADATRTAKSVHEEFVKRGFHGPWLPIEQLAKRPLDRLAGMVLLPPSDPDDRGMTTLLLPSGDLTRGYRARRPDGIDAWRAGCAEAYDVGVLQLVVTEEVRAAPAAKTMFDLACATHDLQVVAGDPQVIFKIYEAGVPGVSPFVPGLLGHREALKTWERVRTWGLRDINDLDPLIAGLEEQARHYNYDARPSLRRPFGDAVPRSRFDFILDTPDDPYRPGGYPPTWVADGAEVVREVIDELRKIVPPFANPRPTRGATKRFGHFCGDLKSLSLFRKLVTDAEQIDFPE